MNDFLLEYYNLITYCFEFLAAATGIILYKKYKHTAAKFFVIFLIMVFACDLANMYIFLVKDNGILSFLEDTVLRRNFWWTTLYWKIGAIIFVVFYYNKVLKRPLFIKIIKISGYSFVLYSVLLVLINLDEYFVKFFPSISVFGAVIIFMCTVFYFIETLISDKILTFYKSLNFYISAAIFIWWLIITPLVFYDIYNSHRDWNFIFLKWQIYLFANILMYSTFTFALIWCRPEND
ncbi:hypothetical protein [Cognatitamlana onchidii]|uniref:hypothetical protein n=1 Tax=Cognatitamlana onchidii TaxID=2562860 RepID=UPI001F1ABB60|nr:hypothetical protein [Algibacter onchidii]